MADPNNQGQFGNRPDTTQQASRGGRASSGKFGSEHGANPSAAGKKGAANQSIEAKRKGAENQPTEAKRRGGRHSHLVA